MLSNQTLRQQVAIRIVDSGEINRLLAAAVVSHQFRALLLSDPARAIAQGFAGEQFFLSPDEYNLVLSVPKASLQEFASQLHKYMPERAGTTQPVNNQTDSYLKTTV